MVGVAGPAAVTVHVAGSTLSGPLFLGIAVVVLAAFAGTAHLVSALRGPFARVLDGLRDGRRDIRFVEYSFTGSITVVLVAALNGVTDAAALVPLYALTAGAALVLLVADRVEVQAGHPQLVRSIALGIGIVPWGVVALGQVAGILAGDGPSIAVRVLTLVLLAAAVLVVVSAWRERPGATMVAGELRYLVITTLSTTVLAWSIATGVVAAG